MYIIYGAKSSVPNLILNSGSCGVRKLVILVSFILLHVTNESKS